MKKISMSIFVIIVLLLAGCAQPVQGPRAAIDPDSTVSQISTYGALSQGVYTGETTYARLKELGNFGIGTFDGIDGEMIALDGSFYQVKVDGTVLNVKPEMTSPFATVHFFNPDVKKSISSSIDNMDALKQTLDGYRDDANDLYAIKITGKFDHLKLRSVPKQSRPYPPLTEVVAKQKVFDYDNLAGTMVGYWMPDYINPILAPGYHFHFISHDKARGGHVLDCSLSQAEVAIDDLDRLVLTVPENDDYQNANLHPQK